MGENGDGWVPLVEGDGTQLVDMEGQPVYETPGWCLLRNQHRYALYNQDGNLCFEPVDEDELALMMRSLPRRALITAEQMDSMIEQNQQLQSELDQSLLAHWTDAKRSHEAVKQRDAQIQSDFRAMEAEFEKRQAEWVKKACIDKEKRCGYSCGVTVEQRTEQTERCEEWMAFVQQLQDDQAKHQKEADDDHAHREAKIEKQCVHQEQWHIEQQWRLHVSQNSMQSSALYNYHSYPSVQVHAPLLPSLQQQLPPAPLLRHPSILVNVLPQVPVVDFVQQRMIAQIPLTRQENEVKRLEQDLCNSLSYLNEAV